MKYKQSILMMYTGDDWKKEAPYTINKNYQYRARNYESFTTYCKENDILFVRASLKWYDKKTGEFKRYWHFNGEKWEKVRKRIKPTAIFEKSVSRRRVDVSPMLYNMISHGIKVFNKPSFRNLFGNKVLDLQYWSEHMPRSVVAYDEETARRMAKKIFGWKKFVAKEVYGTGGNNVYIGKMKEIPFEKARYPIILQEFLESVGAPGLEGTVSDLRMEYINHKLVSCYSRVAQDGLYTNTNKGAKVVMIPKSKIPKEVKAIVKDMQKKMKSFKHCQYALDFFFTEDGPKLIESGCVPIFGIPVQNKKHETFMQGYFKALSTAVLEVE